MKMKSLFFATIFCFYSLTSFAGQKALVIIDLQPFFAERADYKAYPENNQLAKDLMKKEIEAIKMAKKQNIPIIKVEYENMGKSFPEIDKALEGYKNQTTIQKSTDGLFDENNISLKEVKEYLKSKDIDTLIITGANGFACVYSSIEGALKNNYNVIAYSGAIADFNYEKIIFPFGELYNNATELTKPNCSDCVFKNVTTVEHLSLEMTRDSLDKNDEDESVNNTNRAMNKDVSSKTSREASKQELNGTKGR